MTQPWGAGMGPREYNDDSYEAWCAKVKAEAKAFYAEYASNE